MSALTHKGTQTIKTERLILRKFTLDDAEAMYKNWASNLKVTEFLSWQPHDSIEESRRILTMWIESYAQDTYYHWGIEMKELGQVIGAISSVGNSGRNKNVEVGYCLSDKYWNIGIMTEALTGVINYFFTEIGYHRVAAGHDVNNIGSGKVMEKVGMVFEGIKRESHLRRDGTYGDVKYMSILKHEWK